MKKNDKKNAAATAQEVNAKEAVKAKKTKEAKAEEAVDKDLSKTIGKKRSFAMAEAVITWSPVIITGRMPALRQTATAAFASGRGGSIMPTRPTNSCIPITTQELVSTTD